MGRYMELSGHSRKTITNVQHAAWAFEINSHVRLVSNFGATLVMPVSGKIRTEGIDHHGGWHHFYLRELGFFPGQEHP